MNEEAKRVIELFKSNKNEEKIAGIFLCNQLLERVQRHSKYNELVYKLLRKVDTEIIIALLTSNNTKSNHKKMKFAMIDYLYYCSKSNLCLELLIQFVDKLTELFLSIGELEIQRRVLDTLLAISSVIKTEKLENLINRIVVLVDTHPQSDVSLVLELIIKFLSISNSIQLSSDALTAMKSLLIQGLHGAAPELIRDRCLVYCRDLLYCSENTDWLFQEDDKISGDFILFLSSIVKAELFLVTEELVTLTSKASEADEQDSDDHTNVIVDNNPANVDTVDSNSNENQSDSKRSSSKTPSLSYLRHSFASRAYRSVKMITVCTDIFKATYMVLIGQSPKSCTSKVGLIGRMNDEEEAEDLSTLADQLNFEELLNLKSAFQGIASNLVQFLKDFTVILLDSFKSSTGSHIGGAQNSAVLVTTKDAVTAIENVVCVVTRYALEDDDTLWDILRMLDLLAATYDVEVSRRKDAPSDNINTSVVRSTSDRESSILSDGTVDDDDNEGDFHARYPFYHAIKGFVTENENCVQTINTFLLELIFKNENVDIKVLDHVIDCGAVYLNSLISLTAYYCTQVPVICDNLQAFLFGSSNVEINMDNIDVAIAKVLPIAIDLSSILEKVVVNSMLLQRIVDYKASDIMTLYQGEGEQAITMLLSIDTTKLRILIQSSRQANSSIDKLSRVISNKGGGSQTITKDAQLLIDLVEDTLLDGPVPTFVEHTDLLDKLFKNFDNDERF